VRGEGGAPEPAYRLLVVDDEESIRVSLEEALSDAQHRVLTAARGKDAMEILASEGIDLVLLDQKLKESGEDGIDVLREIRRRYPWLVVIMMTAFGRIESAVEATKLGCFQYITKPLEVAQLKLVIAAGLANRTLSRAVEAYRHQEERAFPSSDPFGPSPKTREMLDHVKLAASSPTSTVLIRGETGSGKELVARLIHGRSPVADGPFVDFNCAAVPENLIESELFGHEKGAFTDAKLTRRGLFELADHGSLFLDEIGEMPLPMQAKFLRVLETKSFRKLGAAVDTKVSVRVIAATNKDLHHEVQDGRFREDLYYRLDVIPVHVPPLRERHEDIPVLATHFLERFNRELGRSIREIAPGTMKILSAYAWPGNIRELKNLMERLVLMTRADELRPEHLPPHILGGHEAGRVPGGSGSVVFPEGEVLRLEQVEREAILHTLSRLGGNKTRAAEALGISRQTLRTKLREYGVLDEEAASF
jgi:DNA-binding NtrC family response regulator